MEVVALPGGIQDMVRHGKPQTLGSNEGDGDKGDEKVRGTPMTQTKKNTH